MESAPRSRHTSGPYAQATQMAYRTMSAPDPLDPARSTSASDFVGTGEDSEPEGGLSLTEVASALSAHGGGALSADLALDLVLNEIVEHARLATGATAAAIALARGGEIVCRATTGANAPDLGVRLDVRSGLSGACVQTRMWQRCDDSEIDSRVDAEVCRGLGVRSIVVFPVVKGDSLLGVIEIFSPRPNAFSDREIQTLQALSRSVVSNVDRAADVPAVSATMPEPSAMPAAADTPGVDQDQIGESSVDEAPTEAAPSLNVLSDVVTGPAPKDRWMGVLTLLVIAAALFLGWTIGYVRRQRAPFPTKAKAAAVAATPLTSPRPSGTSPAPDQTMPAIIPPPPAPAQKNGTGVVPAGGLVVYENGKVIYRTQAESSPQARDLGRQPMVVPSKVADEYLVARVEPEYPEQAREQHVQGAVVLLALVGKDGAVEKLSTISGDSQLVAAATDAVLQWRFKPFFRNGSPEEFQTQITVSFRLP